MPDPHVICAVPWDLKLTPSAISQCLKCLSYCMVLFWLPCLCQELRSCCQYSNWPMDLKNRGILVQSSAGADFCRLQSLHNSTGPI